MAVYALETCHDDDFAFFDVGMNVVGINVFDAGFGV